MNANALRAKFIPPQIRALFVGESPPAGGTFFYAADSNLFRYTNEAFAIAFGRQVPRGPGFLDYFRAAGCYLDDLCSQPVNHMEDADRRAARLHGVDPLAHRLATFRPHSVIAVPLSIMRHVTEAVRRSGLSGVIVHGLPFPAMGHQRRFVSELAPLLTTLQLGTQLA